MLREIGSIRQDSTRGARRWFQDDYFDLFVWQDAAGRTIAFQLCYDRNRGEGAISWSEDQGFTHARVDSGEQAQKHGMSPILRASGVVPYFRVYRRFIAASSGWEPPLRDFLLGRLHDYRHIIYGRRRAPRRRRMPRHAPSTGSGGARAY